MPVRNNSASLRASTLSFLLPSFSKALRRGLQTRIWCTCGFNRSYSHAAHVPSSQVTCSSPCSTWINCRMLLALVSTIDSITWCPLTFSTAITIASLCTSIPIYLTSRLIELPPWGEAHSCQRLSFPQGTMPSITTAPLVADVNHPESVAHSRRYAQLQSCEAGRSFIMH